MLREQKEVFKVILCFVLVLAFVLAAIFGVRYLVTGKSPTETTEVVVWNSEEGEVAISCTIAGMTFGDNIGRIFWDKGVMSFEGDADESARIFFEEFLKPYIDDYIKSELEKEELIELIPEEPEDIMYQFTTSFDYVTYQPVWFLKVVNTDMSKCFIDGRLRLDLNGEIYWIRVEKD